MGKRLQERSFLQAMADQTVRTVAPGHGIAAVASPDENRSVWDGKGLGRAPWHADYILPPNDTVARGLIPKLNVAMARWRRLYDLRLTYKV
jgi:hypothetical protein